MNCFIKPFFYSVTFFKLSSHHFLPSLLFLSPSFFLFKQSQLLSILPSCNLRWSFLFSHDVIVASLHVWGTLGVLFLRASSPFESCQLLCNVNYLFWFFSILYYKWVITFLLFLFLVIWRLLLRCLLSIRPLFQEWLRKLGMSFQDVQLWERSNGWWFLHRLHNYWLFEFGFFVINHLYWRAVCVRLSIVFH